MKKITKTELEFYRLGKELNPNYKKAEPFPHCVIDNLLNSELLKQISKEFKINENNLISFNNPNEKKIASAGLKNFGEKTKELLEYFNGSDFLHFLELLTGINGLISDESLEGGGLHQIERGGYLKIHADFNKHSVTNLDRRLNLLLFLNEKWSQEWGGDFEMWSRDAKYCEKKVIPNFNRMVIFSTTDHSYHGHPDPLNCPIGIYRRSIALYYYTSGRPTSEIRSGLKYHSTLFVKRSKKHQDLKMFIYNMLKNWNPKQMFKFILPGQLVDWIVEKRRKRQ